jgi:methanogenic corrinoid protein MtbC1
VRGKVNASGAPVTEAFARQIGADGYLLRRKPNFLLTFFKK